MGSVTFIKEEEQLSWQWGRAGGEGLTHGEGPGQLGPQTRPDTSVPQRGWALGHVRIKTRGRVWLA